MHAQRGKQLDALISSPLDSMSCHFCGEVGNRSISGRLLYLDGERWVHANCALWSVQVKEKPSEHQMSGVMQVLRNTKQALNKCNLCNKVGASLVCIGTNCKNKFHFYCGFSNGYTFLSCKKVVCQACMLDVQAFCVDQSNNAQCARVKTSLIKTLLNEIVTSTIVNDFTIFRRINVVNSQKQDGKSTDSLFNRFGNTTLLDLQQSSSRPLFKVIKLLINKLQAEPTHRFLAITFNDGDFILQYREYTKTALNNFIKQQMFSQKLAKRPSQIIQLIFETCDQYTLRSFHQLHQFLQDKRFYPQSLPEHTTYEDHIGSLLLLITSFVRSKLQEKIQIESFIIPQETVTHYYEWFYVEEVLEEQPLQQRINRLQQMVQSTALRKPPNTQIQKKHPSLLDFQLDKPKPSTPLKLTISPQTPNKEAYALDRFTLLGEVTPNDILQETNIRIDTKSEGVKEIDKVLRESIDKKKRIALYVGPSRIHKYGLFAKQRIKQSELIIEYTGEVIRNSLADERERVYIEKGFGDCYMFRASKDRVIDASFLGSQARYLNHSCDPNCASSIIEVNDQHKILIYAKRDIQTNEELTYDYQFEVEANKIQCFCGAKNCLGRLN